MIWRAAAPLDHTREAIEGVAVVLFLVALLIAAIGRSEARRRGR